VSGLEHNDLVIGSRRSGDKRSSSHQGGTSAISRLANVVSIPLAPRVKDRTSAIFGFRKAVVNPADLDKKAWNMGLEVVTRGRYAAVGEVPYAVVPDGRAQPGSSWKELVGYTRQVISLYMSKFQILNFMVVGGIGYLINMGAYWLLLRVFKGTETTFLGQHFYLPPFVLSSLLAIVSNYELNKVWTFRGWSEHSVGFLRYLSMALLTLLLDMAALWALVDWGKLTPILAAAVAIAIVFVIRYLIAKRWIWSREPVTSRRQY
jgi:putative flippase GtrA